MHKYTVVCKGFSSTRYVVIATAEPVAIPHDGSHECNGRALAGREWLAGHGAEIYRQKKVAKNEEVMPILATFVAKFCTPSVVPRAHNSNHHNILTEYESIKVWRNISRFREKH